MQSMQRCCCRRVHSASQAARDAYNALTQTLPPVASRDRSRAATQGSLAGLRYTVKESICTADGATTCGSAILGASRAQSRTELYTSPFDATVVRLLSDAGAAVCAKTNMDEFGMGSFSTNSPQHGSVRNPHDRSRSAGGSSGGAAASLLLPHATPAGGAFTGEGAAGRIGFALGTDTGGSVRLPAAYCGVLGFKPSYGRISRLGVVAYANSLDTVGIMARRDDLATLRRVWRVCDQFDPADPTSLPPHYRQRRFEQRTDTLRIGVPREYMIAELSRQVRRAFGSALRRIRDASPAALDGGEDGSRWRKIEIVPVSLPMTAAALSAYYVLAPAEAASNLARYSGVFYGARADADRSAPPAPPLSEGTPVATGAARGQLYAPTRAMFGPEVQRRILAGNLTLSADGYDSYFLQAARVRRLVAQDFDAVFRRPHPLHTASSAGAVPWSHSSEGEGRTVGEGRTDGEEVSEGVDVLLTPTAPSVAPPLACIPQMTKAESLAQDVFTVPASLAGLPACSVPLLPTAGLASDAAGSDDGHVTVAQEQAESAVSDEHMPAGLQVIGQYGDDELVLAVVERLLQVL